jgi:transcriptional regulator with GAF, ATPase, and Fis domain
VLVALALTQHGTLWPLFVPLCALTLAGGTAAVWTHIIARHRMRMLEADMLKVQQELAVVRQALVCEESAAEALEEDLAATARSAGRQPQLAEVHARETETRRRLQALEGELRGLRAAGSVAPTLGSVELERLRQDCEQMGIVTHDPHVLAAYRDLKTAARSSLPVLLLGEPGTGKELFARAVHRLSPRASQPFIAVNMAAISPELFESELFGHVRGSFTGAVGDRKGYFELAHHGTLFLDEIGDLPLLQQGKLLRVLQDKTFYRVGATQATTVDVRVVAATNKDLQRGVSEGWFRQDLYFRLTGLVLRLPPLRERPGDVALLAERFIREAARTDRTGLALSEEALRALQSSPWPGNVRELHHCLEQAVVLAEGPLLRRTDLRLPVQEAAPVAGKKSTRISEADLVSDPASDARVLDCLRRHEFDMQATARALGCDRSTVTQRLKGLGFRALVESGGDHAKAALALAGDPTLLRTVELKLLDYTSHLSQTLDGYPSADAAITACHKRFKNLPDRHFRSLETLIRRHFERRTRSV